MRHMSSKRILIDLVTSRPLATRDTYEAIMLRSTDRPRGFVMSSAQALKIRRSRGREAHEIVPEKIVKDLAAPYNHIAIGYKHDDRVFVRAGNEFHAVAAFDGSAELYRAVLDEQRAQEALNRAERNVNRARIKVEQIRNSGRG